MANQIVDTVGAGTMSASVTTPQELYSIILPRNMLRNNRRFRIIINGSVASAVSLLPNLTFTFEWGSDSISLPQFAIAALLTSGDYQLIITVYANKSLSQQNVRIELKERISALSNVAQVRSVKGSATQNVAADIKARVTITYSSISVGTSMTRDDALSELVG